MCTGMRWRGGSEATVHLSNVGICCGLRRYPPDASEREGFSFGCGDWEANGALKGYSARRLLHVECLNDVRYSVLRSL